MSLGGGLSMACGGVGGDMDPLADVACPICLDPYTEPKALQCGHSLCSTCAQHLVRQADFDRSRRLVNGVDPTLAALKIACPQCRDLTAVPETRKLPTNYAMVDVLNRFKALHPGEEKSVYKNCNSCQQRYKEEDFWHCKSCHPSEGQEFAPSWICSKCGLKYHPGHELTELVHLKQKVQIVRGRIEIVSHDTLQKIRGVELRAKSLTDSMQNMVKALEIERHSSTTRLLDELGGRRGASIVSEAVLTKSNDKARSVYSHISGICDNMIDVQEQCNEHIQVQLQRLESVGDVDGDDIEDNTHQTSESKKRKQSPPSNVNHRFICSPDTEPSTSGVSSRRCTYGVRRARTTKHPMEQDGLL